MDLWYFITIELIYKHPLFIWFVQCKRECTTYDLYTSWYMYICIDIRTYIYAKCNIQIFHSKNKFSFSIDFHIVHITRMSVCLCLYHTIISNFISFHISFHISSPARQSSCINFRNGKFPFYLANSVNERTNNVCICFIHVHTLTFIDQHRASSGIDDFPFLKNCLGDFHYEKSFLSSFFPARKFSFQWNVSDEIWFLLTFRGSRNVEGNIISRKILYSTPWSADTCICLTHMCMLRRGCCAT